MPVEHFWTSEYVSRVVQNTRERGNERRIWRRTNSKSTKNIIKNGKLSGHPCRQYLDFILYEGIDIFDHLKNLWSYLIVPNFYCTMLSYSRAVSYLAILKAMCNNGYALVHFRIVLSYLCVL